MNIRNTANLQYVMKAGVLCDANSLDEIWSKAVPYGNYYWVAPEMYRVDKKRVDIRSSGDAPGAQDLRPRRIWCLTSARSVCSLRQIPHRGRHRPHAGSVARAAGIAIELPRQLHQLCPSLRP